MSPLIKMHHIIIISVSQWNVKSGVEANIDFAAFCAALRVKKAGKFRQYRSEIIMFYNNAFLNSFIHIEIQTT